MMTPQSLVFVAAVSLLALFAPRAAAHGSVATITANGQSYTGPFPAGAVISSPVRQIADLDPVKDVTSSDMTCGFGASPSASEVASVAAGSSIQIQMRSGAEGTPWPHIYGPLMAYMAKCDSTADKCDASTAKFFKIDEKGLRADGTWYQSEINAGHAFNTTIPAGLEDGDYLLRYEMIALHNAMTEGLAEFYVSCTQVRVTGGGSAAPAASDLVSFPGAYTQTDPGILINVFPSANGPLKTYPFPGPAVFTTSGSSGAPTTTSESSVTTPEPSATTPAPSSTTKSTCTSKTTTTTTTPKPKPTLKCRAKSRVMRRHVHRGLDSAF